MCIQKFAYVIVVGALGIIISTYLGTQKQDLEEDLHLKKSNNLFDRKIIVGYRHNSPEPNCDASVESLFSEECPCKKNLGPDSPIQTMSKSLALLQVNSKKKIRIKQFQRMCLKFSPLIKRYSLRKQLASIKKTHKHHYNVHARQPTKKISFLKRFHKIKTEP